MHACYTLAIIALAVSGCANHSPNATSRSVTPMVAETVRFAEPQLTAKDKLDIYESVVRYRLRKIPVSPRSKLYVHINWGVPDGLAQRLRDLNAIIRPGSQGNSPPPGRVFFIMLGRAASGRASLYVEDGKNGLFMDVAKQGSLWIVTDERPAIIT